jgi:hypothetical protein
MVTRRRIREKGMIFMFAGVVRLGAFRPAFDQESYTLDATARKDKIGSFLNLKKKLALELKVAEKGKRSTRRNHIRCRSGDHRDMALCSSKTSLRLFRGQWRVALAPNFCKCSDKRIVLRERLNQYCLDWEMRQLS